MSGDDEDDDPDLFEAYARRTDPETSHAAAESLDEADLTAKEHDVSQVIIGRRDHGATWDEIFNTLIASGIKIAKASISPRFKPLRKKKIIEWRRDEDGKIIKRPGESKRGQTVWFQYSGEEEEEPLL